MLFHIPQVLTKEQVAECRAALDQAEWVDGRATVGHLGVHAKNNRQVPEGNAVSRKLGAMILAALEKNGLFVTAALPLKVYPPTFNRYEGGQAYGNHVDGAIRDVPGTPHRVRTDLSATLFLNAPEDYDGGELAIEDTYGSHQIKLPAGDMILYPGTSVHNVRPVTRGARLASFFWIQSMVRDDGERSTLLELDVAIQQLRRVLPEHGAIVQLTNVYHNLLRRWGDA
jgi:PKHD-type hydroxylase